MNTINKILLAGMITVSLGFQVANAETCSSLTKMKTDITKKVSAFNFATEKGIVILVQYCSVFGINSQCSSIVDIYDRKYDSSQYQMTVANFKNEAIRHGEMSAKNAVIFSDLVDTIYSNYMSRLYAARSLGPINKQWTGQNCGNVNKLLALTDTELLSASQQQQTGVCSVITTKSGKYKVTVAKKEYPMTGNTYESLSEVSAVLREALENSHCL